METSERERGRVVSCVALVGDKSSEPQDDLLAMEGMAPGLAYQLADRGVCTMEDLAELSVDELTEIEGVDEVVFDGPHYESSEPWFADDANESAEEISAQE